MRPTTAKRRAAIEAYCAAVNAAGHVIMAGGRPDAANKAGSKAFTAALRATRRRKP